MKQITVVLDEEQIEQIDKIAVVFNQSRNFTIREALTIFINTYLTSKEKNEVDKILL
jgi:predicted transcriptional regulator